MSGVARVLVTLVFWVASAICLWVSGPLWAALLLFVGGVIVAPRELFKGAFTGEAGGPGVGAGG